MIIFPNAKINLGLKILNRRNDGYHNIETILYPIKLKDALEIIESDQVVFTSSGLQIPGSASENLCLKAWHMIAKDIELPKVHIHLHKQIPIGAGLGGGSADAACCIRLLNEKFRLNLSIHDMEDYSRRLGSDCAFFIQNKPVLATGRGDKMESSNINLDQYFIVMAMPGVHVSTAEAYREVIPNAGGHSLNSLTNRPLEEWRDCLTNDFEDAVFKRYPVVKELKETFYNEGALYASMSGSGASVYAIFRDEICLPELEHTNTVFYGI